MSKVRVWQFYTALFLLICLSGCNAESQYLITYASVLPNHISVSQTDNNPQSEFPNADFYCQDELVGGIYFISEQIEISDDPFLNEDIISFFEHYKAQYVDNYKDMALSDTSVGGSDLANFEMAFTMYSTRNEKEVNHIHYCFILSENMICNLWFDITEFSSDEIVDIIQNLDILHHS